MQEARANWLRSLSYDEKMALTYKDFTVSELHEIISELAVSDEIRQEAILLYIKCQTIEQVAETLGKDRKTILKHKERLSYALRRTITKLFP